MESILLGVLMILLGLSMFFTKDFWWASQEFTNQARGLVSERTDAWEIGTNIRGSIIVLLGFILIYFGVQVHEFRSRPVVPLICNEPSSNLSVKNKVRDAIKIGCAAAQKKEYKPARMNFIKALEAVERIPEAQKFLMDNIVERSNLKAAIKQMDKQLEK